MEAELTSEQAAPLIGVNPVALRGLIDGGDWRYSRSNHVTWDRLSGRRLGLRQIAHGFLVRLPGEVYMTERIQTSRVVDEEDRNAEPFVEHLEDSEELVGVCAQA
jgi:hypothetical protein